jgi:tRNA pseudouridine38-40 synthase
LVDVGRGKISREEFKRILDARDRRQAKMTAPPQGLFLLKVDY